MVVKRTNTGHEALFSTSREVLASIIEITGERYPGVDISRHHSWVTLYYGLPSASILALELLRQTQEAGPHPAMPPRAEIIRNLSVFVSCLSWVATPGQGNYQTCKAVEKKLSDILDQILDPRAMQGDSADVNRDFLLDAEYGYGAGAGAGSGSGAGAGLYGLLNWYSDPDGFDFDPMVFPAREGVLF
ncbi:hypothetical protein BJX76DRAFT_153113 [Aspergillus varians]